jgi:hypothetical protein
MNYLPILALNHKSPYISLPIDRTIGMSHQYDRIILSNLTDFNNFDGISFLCKIIQEYIKYIYIYIYIYIYTYTYVLRDTHAFICRLQSKLNVEFLCERKIYYSLLLFSDFIKCRK